MEEHQSMDEQFLNKVLQTIEDNIDNENFTVEQLAQRVGLSRSMLHRKLIKLTGKSASETITEQRLQSACALLKNNEANVSETAYRVGFKNPSYFNKVFKRHYNISPGQLRASTLLSNDNKDKSSILQHLSARINKLSIQIKFVLIIASITLCSFIIHYVIVLPNHHQTIAVLPLENLTGNTQNDYLIEGMHDALIGELGRISSLLVISRNSSNRYKNSDMLLSDIANELNVDNIVEGSVMTTGDSIHLLVKVIRTNPRERHLMAHNYQNEFANILRLQSQVANDIAKTINVKIGSKQKEAFQQPRRVNPDVYREYLRGMYLMHLGSENTFIEGIKTLQKTIEIDAGEPFAYAGIALGYATLGHGQVNSQASFDLAQNAANKAINLDPLMDAPYTALSILSLYHDWNWPQAKTSFTNALKANPSNAVANAHYAWYHVLFNNQKEAILHAHKATQVEPLSAAYHAWLGLIYCFCNKHYQAEKSAQKALDINPESAYANLVFGWSYLLQGQYIKAIEYHERLPQGLYWDALLVDCYVKCGKIDKAIELWYKYNGDSHNLNICHLGMMAASLGKKDTAFMFLSEAVNKKIYPITYINFYPNSELIRDDARYSQLLSRMNLSD